MKVHKTRYYATILGVVMLALLIGGCSSESESPIIALVDDEPVRLVDLDVTAQIALSKAGFDIETDEGQAYYKRIAPNLYETLITISVMKQTARTESVPPAPEMVEIKFRDIKAAMGGSKPFQRFLKSHGTTEAKYKEAVSDHLAIQNLQKEIFEKVTYTPTDEDVVAFYNDNRAKFRFPNRIRVSHIFTAGAIKDKQAYEKARVRAEQLHKMIGGNPGSTFASLAKDNSDNTQTAPKGGDLGFIERNDPRMLGGIRDAAFQLKVNEMSSVIETDFGFHILWATDHEESIEEAWTRIENQLHTQKRQDALDAWLKQRKSEVDIVRLFDPETFTMIEKKGTVD